MAAALPTLGSFKDLHKGERCFLVGNGPSLSALDLTKLEGELAFTVNRGYLAEKFGLPTTPYYVITDPLTYAPYASRSAQGQAGNAFLSR